MSWIKSCTDDAPVDPFATTLFCFPCPRLSFEPGSGHLPRSQEVKKSRSGCFSGFCLVARRSLDRLSPRSRYPAPGRWSPCWRRPRARSRCPPWRGRPDNETASEMHGECKMLEVLCMSSEPRVCITIRVCFSVQSSAVWKNFLFLQSIVVWFAASIAACMLCQRSSIKTILCRLLWTCTHRLGCMTQLELRT